MANEKRLIDADALIEYINEDHSYSGLPMAAHVLTMELLTYAPTIDAVEVVRGRWEPHPMVPGFVRCSACRDCITYDEWPDGQKWKYCPHCGARMDK